MHACTDECRKAHHISLHNMFAARHPFGCFQWRDGAHRAVPFRRKHAWPGLLHACLWTTSHFVCAMCGPSRVGGLPVYTVVSVLSVCVTRPGCRTNHCVYMCLHECVYMCLHECVYMCLHECVYTCVHAVAIVSAPLLVSVCLQNCDGRGLVPCMCKFMCMVMSRLAALH
jgi:hypothetical protein